MPIDPWMAALASFGGGMAAAGGPSRMPVGMGGALGQGAMSGLAGYAQMREMQQAERSQQLENMKLLFALKEARTKREKEQKKEALFGQLSKNLNPQEQLMFMAAPEQFVTGKMRAMQPMTPYEEAKLGLDQERLKLDALRARIGSQPTEYQKQQLAMEERRVKAIEGNLELRRKEMSGGEGGFEMGSGDSAQATEYLADMKVKVQNGYEPTPDDLVRVDAARSLLERETAVPTKEGGYYKVKNTAPFAAELLGQGQAAPAAGIPGQAAPAGGSVNIERTGPKPAAEERRESALQTMKEMEELLDQAGTEATGPRGWIQDYTEPLKEAVGMEHDPTRPALMSRHSTLKMTVAPLMQPGGNISDRDIEDVNKAIGNLPALLSSPSQAKDAFNTIRRVIGGSSSAPATPAAPAAPAQHARAPRTAAAATPVTGPAVGTVEDGYRFKGGDPADPASWEPAN